jgi:hypothetical protein
MSRRAQRLGQPEDTLAGLPRLRFLSARLSWQPPHDSHSVSDRRGTVTVGRGSGHGPMVTSQPSGSPVSGPSESWCDLLRPVAPSRKAIYRNLAKFKGTAAACRGAELEG